MQKPCSHCGKPAVISLAYVRRDLCREHFLGMVMKRVKGVNRERKLIVKGDTVIVPPNYKKEKNRHPHALALVLRELQKSLPFTLIEDGAKTANKKTKTRSAKNKKTKLALGNDIDELSLAFLGSIMGTRKAVPAFMEKEGAGHRTRNTEHATLIRPLLGIPSEELELYAKLMGWPEGKGREKAGGKKAKRAGLESRIFALISRMEKEHPGARFQLMRSMLDLE